MPDRALHVDELRGKVVAVRAEAVMQHKSAHADAIEPLRDLHAFMVGREPAITTARAHHKGRAIRLLLRRSPHVDERLVFVLIPLRQRSAFRPEFDLGGLGMRDGG